MSELRFETYQPEFIDQQIELVLESTKDWTYFGYPNKEQLLQGYSVETFTPHTRYYAFDGDTLVGFLSSAFEEENRANIQFPFVRPGYDGLADVLMKKAKATFLEAGVEEIRVNLRQGWGDAIEFVKSYGFVKEGVLNTQLFIETVDFDYNLGDVRTEYREIDIVSDREGLITVFQTEMTQTAEQIGAIIDNWEGAENILMNTISSEDGRVITHSMVLRNQQDPLRAMMTHISIYEEEFAERRLEQLKYMFQQLKNKGFKSIQLFGIPKEELETYPLEEFEISRTFRFVKKLAPLQAA